LGISVSHDQKKKEAEKFLKEKGCHKIEKEVRVDIGNKWYRVDVVGETLSGKRIAVECGEVDIAKLIDLAKVFDEVWVFNYKGNVKFFTPPDDLPIKKKYEKLQNHYNELLEKYQDLKRRYVDLKMKWEQLEGTINEGIGKGRPREILQIRCSKRLLLRFKKFVIDREFDTQRAALEYLLNLADREKELLDALLRTRGDISVVKP